jgi:hypothetical protein
MRTYNREAVVYKLLKAEMMVCRPAQHVVDWASILLIESCAGDLRGPVSEIFPPPDSLNLPLQARAFLQQGPEE